MGDGSGPASSVHGLLEPFETFSDDDGPSRKRGIGAISSIPPKTMKGPDLRAAIRNALGPEEPPADILKFISAESDKLAAKVSRSLNLHTKIAKSKQQIEELAQGRSPAGVKPFKAQVEISELDNPVPPELCSWSFTVSSETTFRQLKERLHYWLLGVSKRIDIELMNLQVGNLRNEIALDTFVSVVSARVTSKSTIVNDLMTQLGLGVSGAPEEQIAISKRRAEKLYGDVMQSVAEFQQKERVRSAEQDASLAKTIEKLKGSTPQDLLQQTIDSSIDNAFRSKGIGKSGSSRSGPRVDLAHAYEIAAKGYDDFSEVVMFEEKPAKGEGKSKSGKGKGKGKGKSKSPKTQKGKGKGKGKSGKAKGKSAGGQVFREAGKPKVKNKQHAGKGRGKGNDKKKSNKSRKGRGKGKREW